MGDSAMIDMMTAALHDPFETIHMGVTAENLAESHQVTRGQQDDTGAAVAPARRQRAIKEGRFKSQILPIVLKTRKWRDGLRHRRACPRPTPRPKIFAKLRAVFKKDGTVTAGNASGINDGAAAVVLMDGDTAGQTRRQAVGPAGRLRACRRRSRG